MTNFTATEYESLLEMARAIAPRGELRRFVSKEEKWQRQTGDSLKTLLSAGCTVRKADILRLRRTYEKAVALRDSPDRPKRAPKPHPSLPAAMLRLWCPTPTPPSPEPAAKPGCLRLIERMIDPVTGEAGWRTEDIPFARYLRFENSVRL